MNKPTHRLSKVDVNEISFVTSGDDPTAKMLMAKADPDTIVKCDPAAHKGLKKGETCKDCGYVMKSSPTGRALYVDQAALRRRKRRRLMEDVQKSPHDGDGDGFYSPGPGMPDKTPMPRGYPRSRKRGDEGMDDGADTPGIGRVVRRAGNRVGPNTRVAIRRASSRQAMRARTLATVRSERSSRLTSKMDGLANKKIVKRIRELEESGEGRWIADPDNSGVWGFKVGSKVEGVLYEADRPGSHSKYDDFEGFEDWM